MFKKIIDWFNEPLVLNKQKTKKPTRKIASLQDTIQEQAESINFLIQQLDMHKERAIEHTRRIRELKKEMEYFIKRDNILQNIEMIFDNGKPTIAQIRKIINGK